ncbi:MAG: AI-2E family transporter [Sphingomonadaceae bacterium]|nr:AI-2E family transporter [Sphingomonadaceae bacterium]
MTAKARPAVDDDIAGPSEVRDPLVRRELKKAIAWASVVVAILLVWLLAQPILLIVGGIVFAALLDGGTKLLGRALPWPRGWLLLVVVVLFVLGLIGVFVFAGFEIADQAGELRKTLADQSARLLAWLQSLGIAPENIDMAGFIRQLFGSVGSLTSALGSALGAVATLFLVMVIGLFIAMEPNLYDRGVQWMLPRDARPEFRMMSARMAKTLQRLLAGRLLGMFFEGFLTWLLLSIVGVPMALLLGIIAGLLAFIPNIGAFVTGVLMVAVGLSASPSHALYAFGIYIVVQTIDGYFIVPMVAKRTVDMAPAVTLSTQILFGALFGIVGLALADPIVAMAKAALERRSEHNDEEDEAERIAEEMFDDPPPAAARRSLNPFRRS